MWDMKGVNLKGGAKAVLVVAQPCNLHVATKRH